MLAAECSFANIQNKSPIIIYFKTIQLHVKFCFYFGGVLFSFKPIFKKPNSINTQHDYVTIHLGYDNKFDT